ncbi:hypothetical protein M406DRAFT_230562, partial [Cryphonectria parasitica EP155]
RRSLTEAFSIPELWWSAYRRNLNGYFGCEVTQDANAVDTWALFEVKMINGSLDYKWLKIDIFTRWLRSAGHTVILLFDIQQAVLDQLLLLIGSIGAGCLDDPFWAYSPVLEAVLGLEDSAVWAVRDQVRAIEKDVLSRGAPPRPAYRHLHDLARHAIHATEALEVVNQTVDHILARHTEYARPGPRCPTAVSGLHSRLQYGKTVLSSLRHRSISNEKRLQNEIQLAFNTVAQYDAGTSVEISRAAQVDSAAMRTISVVTLALLPPTFVSAIFSMSFFDYEAGGDWTVSEKFWIYWAFAIPTTFVALAMWHYWDKV